MAGLAHLSLLLTLVAFHAALRCLAFLATACSAARVGWRQGWARERNRQAIHHRRRR